MGGMTALPAPLIPEPLIWVLAGLAVVLCGYGLVRRARGALWRTAFFALAIVALINPQLVVEERETLDDVVVALVDTSESQAVGDRQADAEAAVTAIEAAYGAMPGTELRVVRGGQSRDGTRLFEPLATALSDVPAERLSGVFVITDGRIHDRPEAAGLGALTAPVHALITGDRAMVDRRLVVEQATEFALVDRPVEILVKVEDHNITHQGRPRARLTVRQDGRQIAAREVRVGTTATIVVTPERRGPFLVELEAEAAEGETILDNNRAILTINAVRDRLKVLLISGEPHPGERVWRTALKSDPAVDLIHFTILRLPTSQDPTPVNQLSLIPFPTRRLFEEQLDEFDLVIFDRYTLRGVLQRRYLNNLLAYVEAGGAILVSTGPEFAEPLSLYRTPLAPVLPATPTGRVVTRGFMPSLTDLGARHPVTVGLSPVGEPAWGRWFRLIESTAATGQVLMTGPDELPLLVLARAGEGRVAQLMSDHVWLWARGLEGGGPHQELLRRSVHWLMKEPDLEEEALTAAASGNTITIERRSVTASGGVAVVVGPDGGERTVALTPVGGGRSVATVDVDRPGLYRVRDGDQEVLVGAGVMNARETANLVPTDQAVRPLVEATGGGVRWLQDGLPRLRRVASGATTVGRDWLAVARQEASRTLSVKQTPLLPPVLLLVLLAGLGAVAWRQEGR